MGRPGQNRVDYGGTGMNNVDQTHPAMLLHYRIYKNAGTSIDGMLRQSLGTRWGTCECAPEAHTLSPDEIAAFLMERPDLTAASSHSARPPLPGQHVHPIVLLRHPIDRARAVYHFARRDPTQPGHHVAREGSCLDYVGWSLGTPGVGVVIRNYQVIHLSAASCRYADIQAAEAMEADLVETKVLLLGWAVFGIVRAFAESCRLFKSAFGSKFPDLRFVSRHENISTDRSITEKWPGAISRSEAPLARLDARHFQKQRLRVGMIGPPRKRFG